MKPVIVYLFTNDLRLNDNEALTAAVNQARQNDFQLVLLYCFESWQFPSLIEQQRQMGLARYGFLYQSLNDLNHQLKQHEQTLTVFVGPLHRAISELNKLQDIVSIYTAKPSGWYEQERLRKLKNKLTVHCFDTLTLYQAAQFEFSIDELPKHFTPFRKKVEHVDIPAPLATPKNWPQTKLTSQDIFSTLPEYKNEIETPYIGGSRAGLEHLNNYLSGSLPKNYKNVRNALMGWEHSTKFSAWLALGCISPRQIMAQLKTYEAEHGANESTYWIFFELLWREYFFYLSIQKGPELYGSDNATKPGERMQRFKQWCLGKTSEPLINACMRQLNQTGYMSNRGRQIAASYLINELQIDWQLGACYFEQHLIDYDVASNWGNWQYISGVGADPRGGRHFNIEKQQQTHDPNGEFIRLWQEKHKEPSAISWSQIAKATSADYEAD